ncbi:MAG: S-layer homology domain-containing protein [Propioniciclava sp.]
MTQNKDFTVPDSLILRKPVAATALLCLTLARLILVPIEATAATASAATAIDHLEVVEEDSPPYDRDFFEHWIDADGDGCDTRAEVLQAESLVPVTYSTGCTVATGEWDSWYDEATWTVASDVDVDHMVPLAEAWRSGAWAWSPAQRRDFANDLDFGPSLEAVTDNVNQSKGDRDVADWLPPSAGATCRYLSDWVRVKYRWKLAIDAVEREVLLDDLVGDCGNPSLVLPEQVGAAALTLSFSDVPPEHFYSDEISWLADSEITTGYSDGSFRPLNPVTRRAMAAFLYRFSGEPDFDPFIRATFRDVPASDYYYTEITWLSYTGITKGYSDGRFQPTRAVSRQAMAAFLYRLAGSPTYVPPATPEFADVPKNHYYYKEISWLAQTGITRGYRDGDFKPTKEVTRQAMAAFLYRFNRDLGTPAFEPPANPGNTINCTDFTSWSSAQNWYQKYYPFYGDVAKLDGDNNGIACQSLPGAP